MFSKAEPNARLKKVNKKKKEKKCCRLMTQDTGRKNRHVGHKFPTIFFFFYVQKSEIVYCIRFGSPEKSNSALNLG